MRRCAAVFVLALTLCLPLAAQDKGKSKALPLVVSGDVRIITVVKSVPFKITAPADFTLFDWSYPDAVRATAEDNVLVVNQAPQGAFVVRVRMTLIDFEKKKVTRETAEVEVNYGGVVPPGPDPGPDPKPPTPDPPTPSPSPIPEPGLRVLIVEDAKNRAKLPAAQFAILFDKSFRDYLNSVCVPDGKVKAWRIWDAGVDATAESAAWQGALKRDRKSLPWIVVSNHPRGGYEGPLPATVEETTALVKKYAEMKKEKRP